MPELRENWERIERELKDQGKVVDADEMLRPRLKAYALATKRK